MKAQVFTGLKLRVDLGVALPTKSLDEIAAPVLERVRSLRKDVMVLEQTVESSTRIQADGSLKPACELRIRGRTVAFRRLSLDFGVEYSDLYLSFDEKCAVDPRLALHERQIIPPVLYLAWSEQVRFKEDYFAALVTRVDSLDPLEGFATFRDWIKYFQSCADELEVPQAVRDILCPPEPGMSGVKIVAYHVWPKSMWHRRTVVRKYVPGLETRRFIPVVSENSSHAYALADAGLDLSDEKLWVSACLEGRERLLGYHASDCVILEPCAQKYVPFGFNEPLNATVNPT